MCDAMKNGYNVEYLLTVFAKDVSYMYNVQHIRLSEEVVEEIDTEHITVSMDVTERLGRMPTTLAIQPY